MKVHVEQLQVGCIVSEDIIGLSNRPIIPKKTIINQEHITILKAFLIKDIKIEPFLVTGKKFTPTSREEMDMPGQREGSSFLEVYLHTIRHYKKLFEGWQAGSPVDVASLRKILVPLFEHEQLNANMLFSLHHYSAVKDYLHHHAVSVALLSMFLAGKLNYTQKEIMQIGIAGALIDCGMAKVPPSILSKSGALTAKEFEEVKQHPVHSYQMLKQNSAMSENIRLAVLQHHERIDGSGYPLGVTGEKLHSFSKIIAVADVFHAMTSERKYKKKQSSFRVLESIIKEHFGKFDIQTVQALTSGIANMSNGSRVRLSNNETGEIVYIDAGKPTRPMIKMDETGAIIQLTDYHDLHIEEVIKY